MTIAEAFELQDSHRFADSCGMALLLHTGPLYLGDWVPPAGAPEVREAEYIYPRETCCRKRATSDLIVLRSHLGGYLRESSSDSSFDGSYVRSIGRIEFLPFET